MIVQDCNFDKLDLYKTKILRKDIYSNEKTNRYTCCPHCGCKNFICFGKYNGIQRYKCKLCNKTFSNATNSLWKYLKKSPEEWLKFLELLVENKTLEYCAKTLDISIVTAFNWRHKILHAIEKIYVPKQFENLIFMEMHYGRISYKGSKNKHFEFASDFNKRYNIAPRNVYTIISYDINDNMLIEKIGVKQGDNAEFVNNIKGKFKNDVCRLCDKESYIHIDSIWNSAIHDEIIKHNKRIPIKIRRYYEFNPKSQNALDNIKCSPKVNKIAVKFRGWLGIFRGVATKYLDHYCNLFALNFVNKPFDYMEVFSELLSSSCSYASMKKIKSIHIEDY